MKWSLEQAIDIIKDESDKSVLKQFVALLEEVRTIAEKDKYILSICYLYILPYFNECMNYQIRKQHYEEVDDWYGQLPDDRVGLSVYLLFDRATKLLKIGTTANVRKRLRSIRLSSPSGKNIIILAYCKGTIKEEKYFHRRFHYLHTHGEWFKPHKEILDFFEKQISEGKGRFYTSYVKKYAHHFKE